MKVSNLTSPRTGSKVANQFIMVDGRTTVFQSYDSIIVKRVWHYADDNADGFSGYKITLDKNYWDYSVTTGKYRNQFLGENKATTLKKIKSGEYQLADLNKESE